jgi:hypothetical protein
VPGDPWSSEPARIAAGHVFRLGEDYPLLRPRAAAACAAVRAAAFRLGARGGPVPRQIVEEVRALLGTRELRRLELLADAAAPGRWRPLVDAVGTEHAHERRPPPRWLAAMREGTADDAPGPLNVLASLLHPQSVWSIDEARAAETLAAAIDPLGRRLAGIASFARLETKRFRLERLRAVAEPVEALLPVVGVPRTTADLAEACALVATDDEAAAETCMLTLLTYVMGLDGLVMEAPSLN